MKTRHLILAIGGAVILAGSTLAIRAAEESGNAVHGSIPVAGKTSKPERAAMAKISFDEALQAAHAAQPGKVVNAVLEAEDGSLQYAFEILNPVTGKIDEVAIDAGNGKVLSIDRDDKD